MSILDKVFTKRDEKKGGTKPMIDLDDMMLQEFFKCESVFRHQSISFPRFSKENPVTLGFLLKALFPKCEGKVKKAINLSITGFGDKPKSIVISSPHDVESVRPIEASLYTDKKGEEYPRTGLNNIYVITFVEGAPMKEVLFHFRGVGGYYYKTAYFRMSVMIPPLGQKDDLHSGKPGGEETLAGKNYAAEQTSFLIVEDRADNRAILAKYESIERDVERKVETQIELSDIERSIYNGFREFRALHDYIGYGKWLAGQERWLDAYRQFVRVWHVAHHILNNNPGDDHSWYFSLAYDMGRCLSNLKRFDEAAYYLELAAEKEKGAEEELNRVYVHLGDIRVKEVAIPSLIVRKAEMQKETAAPYQTKELSIGDMLGELFGAVPGSLTSMVIRSDSQSGETIIDEPFKVWNTPLAAIACDRTTAVIMYSPVGYITGNESDKSKLCVNNTFVIRVHKAETDYDDGLLRINIMLPAFNFDSDKMFLREENTPEGFSILLGTTDPPTVESRINSSALINCYNLSQSGRYLESCFEAKYIFNRLISRWDELNEYEKIDFFEAAYQLGFCYMDFRLTEKAQYYLEIASQRRIMLYMQEYLNCLSNSYDPRTMSVIDSFLKMEIQGDEPKAIHDWKCFLNRRKAYVLVEARRFDEAKVVLNELLTDPDPTNQSYAKNELAYIESRS